MKHPYYKQEQIIENYSNKGKKNIVSVCFSIFFLLIKCVLKLFNLTAGRIVTFDQKQEVVETEPQF